MRFALDATYSIDSQPSGIAVYSNHLLDGLAAAYPQEKFIHCYRPKQYWRARRSAFSNVSNRILLPALPTFHADLFHALNQRIEKRPARHVVATFHDLFVMTGEYSSPEFRARFTEQARRAADRADLIIAVSEFTARQVSELLTVEPARIRVVPHGVQMPPGPLQGRREPLILFVGAIQARKNVTRLVEAFETLPPPWRLVLAGAPNGFKAAEILARIHESSSRERIEVTGYIAQESLNRLLSRASIFAFPSLDEGFGMPVLDAMAWEIPVVTADASALREIGSGAALLVDPHSVAAIAEALRRLAEQEWLRVEMIRAGKVKVKEFSWQQAVDKTYAVYKELTG
ncbi:MAG TPA: glycosyltransferase family 1 protein [Bryobacteraceae bacterium]|nr:glycosyltransferase family 1 protein [Bryobacteraceae bacterium]